MTNRVASITPRSVPIGRASVLAARCCHAAPETAFKEMVMSVKPVPEGYHSVTPYLIVDGAAAALEFYAKAFGAAELFRMPMGDRIGHAEMRIGDSIVMLADEWPDMGYLGPRTRGGSAVGLMIYVPDVDAVFGRALAAGATQER